MTMPSLATFCCPLLLHLLIILGGVGSSPAQQQGAPADSDEVDYIPKEVVAASTARPAKASRLPNILTSLEIPPAYLQEILRSDNPPQKSSYDHSLQHRRLYQPHPPQPQDPRVGPQGHRYRGQYYQGLGHKDKKHGGGQYYNGEKYQKQKGHYDHLQDQKDHYDHVQDQKDHVQDQKDHYDHVQDQRHHVEPPVSRRSRDKTTSGGLHHGANDVVKTLGSKPQWSWDSSQEAVTEDPHAAPQGVETASMGPRFDRTLPRQVTVQAGKTAVLSCRVLDSSEKSVSWMRHEDLHILSVGKYKYSTDERVSVALDQERQEWLLTIQKVGLQDSGMYECQVSTKPVLSFIVSLQVVVPRAEVVNGPEIFVHRGSLINLTCVVTHGTQRPVYVYWYHHNKVLDYEGRGGVTVITKASSHTVSHLLMRAATPDDSGLYSCRPSNGQEASATLHVLNGEHQAAMQSDASPKIFAPPIAILLGVCLTYILQLHMSNIDGAP